MTTQELAHRLDALQLQIDRLTLAIGALASAAPRHVHHDITRYMVYTREQVAEAAELGRQAMEHFGL